jgi:REP element-mobilizing transposase RayT
MAKTTVKIEDVEFTLQKNQIDPTSSKAVVEDLKKLLDELQEQKDLKSKNTKQFVVLISDPNGEITSDHVAWVLQIPEDESPATVIERLNKSAATFNLSKKGRKFPVSTIGETIEGVTRKILVEENELWVKTKEPVLVVKTDNKLSDILDNSIDE